MPNVMAAQPNIGGAVCESSVIPFLVPRRKVWLTPAAGVRCSILRWALVNLDGVASSRMVSMSASVNLPLHHKVQKFSSGTGSPGWSRK